MELLAEVLGALRDCLLTRRPLQVGGRGQERGEELSVHLLCVARQGTGGYLGGAVG